MTAVLQILRAGPLTTVQDEGRFGMLRHGVSASGPMDRAAYEDAGAYAGGGRGGIEFTTAGLEIALASGSCRIGFSGGHFKARHNGRKVEWIGGLNLEAGDTLDVTPGDQGNYGYVRFGGDILTKPVMGSISTSSRARLGGLHGRSLHAGDVLELSDPIGNSQMPSTRAATTGPLRVIWGIHAHMFTPAVQQAFVQRPFVVSTRMDRMGVRLDDREGVFAGQSALSLVSDAVVPGDIQILGDGTPIVLMRDHQPTGGYPRIATIITADLDRFAQLRPGSTVAFSSVSVKHAHAILRGQTT